MNRTIIFITLLCLVFSCAEKQKSEMDSEVKGPTEIEKLRIYDAVPEAASVPVERPRKLLVFSLAWGFIHDVFPWGIQAFESMAEKTAAFQVVVSNDVTLFESQNLRQFDAIVFNNSNNEIFLPDNYDELSQEARKKATDYDEKLKKNFVDFLKSGRGLAVIHAGVAVFRKWPEYGEIIGARFDNHPWVSGSTVTLKVEEPDHPLVRAIPENTFQVTDEIYQMAGPYSREKLKVLLSVDTSKTDMTVEGVHRTDGDFAMSWIKNYGKGRIFYCALGHQKHIFWDPTILRHLLDGIQFVLGDLECDTTPSAQVR